jgi:hypothetical protein
LKFDDDKGGDSGVQVDWQEWKYRENLLIFQGEFDLSVIAGGFGLKAQARHDPFFSVKQKNRLMLEICIKISLI